MTPSLPPRRAQLWRFIAHRVARTGMSPSYDEMLTAMGWASKSMIHREVAALAQAGFIRVIPKRARCIEVLIWPEPQAFVAVQVPGHDMRLVEMRR